MVVDHDSKRLTLAILITVGLAAGGLVFFFEQRDGAIHHAECAHVWNKVRPGMQGLAGISVNEPEAASRLYTQFAAIASQLESFEYVKAKPLIAVVTELSEAAEQARTATFQMTRDRNLDADELAAASVRFSAATAALVASCRQ